MSSPKDKEELVINPTTGQLDTVRSFNPDRILTHDYSTTGGPLASLDMQGQPVFYGPLTVTDNNGNVVTN